MGPVPEMSGALHHAYGATGRHAVMRRHAKGAMAGILDAVVLKTGIPEAILRGRSAQRDVVRARHGAMFKIWRETGADFYTIGLFFNRDHTSVAYAVKKAQARGN